MPGSRGAGLPSHVRNLRVLPGINFRFPVWPADPKRGVLPKRVEHKSGLPSKDASVQGTHSAAWRGSRNQKTAACLQKTIQKIIAGGRLAYIAQLRKDTAARLMDTRRAAPLAARRYMYRKSLKHYAWSGRTSGQQRQSNRPSSWAFLPTYALNSGGPLASARPCAARACG